MIGRDQGRPRAQVQVRRAIDEDQVIAVAHLGQERPEARLRLGRGVEGPGDVEVGRPLEPGTRSMPATPVGLMTCSGNGSRPA